LLVSVADPERCLEALKGCFVISFSLFSNETAEALADIVLPDACYLERLDLPSHGSMPGQGDWACQLCQPVVAPLHQRRPSSEVLLEIGERLGIADAMNARTNDLYGLRPPHALGAEQRYSWEEMADRICQNWFGPEHGLEWFRQNGVLTWPKSLQEAFCKPFGQARMPLRPERLPRLGEEAQRSPQIGFDLQAVSYQVPWHTVSPDRREPGWMKVQSEPYCYFICRTHAPPPPGALADGDPILVESTAGRRVPGRARLSEGVHPEAVAIAGNGGHWARGMPVARGQSAFFNALLSFDPEMEPACDIRVRVYKE
jgi:anaerobic selenocysteine-containing dehydrogenase